MICVFLEFRKYNKQRRDPLFSDIPQLLPLDFDYKEKLLLFIRHSPIMALITSFEFDLNYVLTIPKNDKDLFFRRANNLTHITIAFNEFDDCIRFLNQIGALSLHSLNVGIKNVRLTEEFDLSQISLVSLFFCFVYFNLNIIFYLIKISCPTLKELKLKIYRNISAYEQYIIPFLQRFSTVEHLTLLLAIELTVNGRNHFIDGSDLQRDIISYMPNLFQFNFHIRSILKHADHIKLDKIRQSFIQYEQFIDYTIDYFNNEYGQCQIYSLPFIGTRLDFISNRFPLFDVENRFSNVTMLTLYDDITPFEHIFFQRIAQVLRRLKVLEVFNLLQQEKTPATNNSIEFRYLTTLILHDVHADYVEQFLCRSYLPCLIQLVIRNDLLVEIIKRKEQEIKNNCSKIETLITLEPWIYPSCYRKYFPNLVTHFERMVNNRLYIES